MAVCCPSCGYDLRGIPERRCPECGFGYDKPAIRDLACIYGCQQVGDARRCTVRAIVAAALVGPQLLEQLGVSPLLRLPLIAAVLMGAVIGAKALAEPAPPKPFDWPTNLIFWSPWVCISAGMLIAAPGVGSILAIAALGHAWILFGVPWGNLPFATRTLETGDRAYLDRRRAMALAALMISTLLWLISWL